MTPFLLTLQIVMLLAGSNCLAGPACTVLPVEAASCELQLQAGECTTPVALNLSNPFFVDVSLPSPPAAYSRVRFQFDRHPYSRSAHHYGSEGPDRPGFALDLPLAGLHSCRIVGSYYPLK